MLAKVDLNSRMVQEHRCFNEGHDLVHIRTRIEILALCPRGKFGFQAGSKEPCFFLCEHEWGIFRPQTCSILSPPDDIVPRNGSAIVFQLDNVEGVAIQNHRVDFVPSAICIAKFEVGPTPVGALRWHSILQVLQALSLVVKFRRADLNPPVSRQRPLPFFMLLVCEIVLCHHTWDNVCDYPTLLYAILVWQDESHRKIYAS